MANQRGTASRACPDRGASAIEFALVAPLLFLLLFGVIEMARGIAVYTAVSTSAREAAQYATTVGESEVTPGTARYLDCAGIREAARQRSPMIDLDDSDIVIVYDGGPASAVLADCQGGTPPTADLIGSQSRAVVTVSSEFATPIPVLSNILGELDVTATQSRTILRGTVGG